MAGEPVNKRAREASVQKSPAEGTTGAPSMASIDDAEDHNVDLSSDIKGILAALQQVRQKALCDGQKKSEELLTSVSAEIKSLVDDVKKRVEKERQILASTTSKVCKESEAALKEQADKYKRAYETFCNAKDLHLQAYEDVFAKFEDAKEKIVIKCEQQRKKEKTALNGLQKTCAEKIATVEHSVKKKKQDEKSIHMLKKSLGSIFDSDGSDEDLEE